MQALGRVLKLLKERGFTIVLVEQNFRFASKIADRHYFMEHGRIKAVLGRHELAGRADELHQWLGV